MITYLTLPSTAPTDLLASTGTIFSDLWILVSVAIGIPLAFFIIDLIISLVWPEHTSQYTQEELENIARGIKK